jgi:beta-mannosidase
MAFYAVKRENKPITTGLARNSEGEVFLIEAWACNMTLKGVRARVQIKAWDVRSGRIVWDHTLHTDVHLKANQSTELGKIDLTTVQLGTNGQSLRDHAKDLAFAIYLLSNESPNGGRIPQSGRLLARHVNFHEPLKEVPFQASEDDLVVNFSSEGGKSFVELRAKVPLKGVFLEFAENKGVLWDDSGVDLVPDEVVRIGVAGIKPNSEQILIIKWLGQKSWQTQVSQIIEPISILNVLMSS